MSESVTIRLPWPDRKLHAHNTGHWRSKAPATANARTTARWVGAEAKARSMPWTRATIRLHFRMPNRRNRDLLNLAHSCKPYIDGLVDCGWLTDDNMHVLTGVSGVTWSHAKDDPGVDVTIERLGDEREGER